MESKNAETNEKFQQLVTDKQGLELDLYTRVRKNSIIIVYWICIFLILICNSLPWY